MQGQFEDIIDKMPENDYRKYLAMILREEKNKGKDNEEI